MIALFYYLHIVVLWIPHGRQDSVGRQTHVVRRLRCRIMQHIDMEFSNALFAGRITPEATLVVPAPSLQIITVMEIVQDE